MKCDCIKISCEWERCSNDCSKEKLHNVGFYNKLSLHHNLSLRPSGDVEV